MKNERIWLKIRCFIVGMAAVYLFLSLTTTDVLAKSKGSILWITNDAPPFYIKQGAQSGQGFGDLIQKMIVDRMVDYEHQHEFLPLSRVLAKLDQEQPLCFSTWIHDTRADIVRTSIPYLYYYPHGVVLTKKTLSTLGDPQQISFDEILQQDLTFGQPLGRGYGNQLDPILARHEGSRNIVVRGGEDSTAGIFRMLGAGRIDYTIEYPYTMFYFSRVLDMENDLTFVPLSENVESGLLGAIACTKTEWGQSVLKDINNAIIGIRELPEYKDILTEWVVIEGRENEYWDIYEEQVIRPFDKAD